MNTNIYSFDKININNLLTNSKNIQQSQTCLDSEPSDELSMFDINSFDKLKFDKTTTETYRIKRLYKLDVFTDQEIPPDQVFTFDYMWNPYTGQRIKLDPIGPLYFNAIKLYDYYFNNRYKGLWNPPVEQFQGFYGDLLGTGKRIKIKSRGTNPEKYLYRLPVIDCYLQPTHNYSLFTMGPELTDYEISLIDNIVLNLHPHRTHTNFTSLSMLKYFYDNALNSLPDPNSDVYVQLKNKYTDLSDKEINEKYNRYWVDKLVKIKY